DLRAITRTCVGSIWLSDAIASSLIPSTTYWSFPLRSEDENGRTAMLTALDGGLDADPYKNIATKTTTSNMTATADPVFVCPARIPRMDAAAFAPRPA